ncbi:hypothetical protein IE985_10635 [Klebsiella pneumoniae]|nr:hypothetical protein [Klebsiella pneumoniae]
MSFKLFPRQRTAPASIPLFSSGTLMLSARGNGWTARDWLIPIVSCIATCVVIGAISMTPNDARTMPLFAPKAS